jgi:Tfp pilus assembly protein PilO
VNRRAPLIAGGAIALVAVILMMIFVLPKRSEVGEVQDQLTAAQDQESALQAQLAALQDAQAAAPETERQIAEIEEQIPPTADLPALINQLQGAADRAALDFFSFSPGTPIPDASGQLSVIQTQITVSGTYFALDEFLFLLETLPRAAKVESITVTPNQASTTSTTTAASPLQMAMTVDFFTTDVSAGPASVPGPTEGAATAPTGTTGSTPTSTTGEET